MKIEDIIPSRSRWWRCWAGAGPVNDLWKGAFLAESENLDWRMIEIQFDGVWEKYFSECVGVWVWKLNNKGSRNWTHPNKAELKEVRNFETMTKVGHIERSAMLIDEEGTWCALSYFHDGLWGIFHYFRNAHPGVGRAIALIIGQAEKDRDDITMNWR